MEIKTCEQYVINRLDTFEREADEKDQVIEKLTEQLTISKALLALIKNNLDVRLSSDEDSVILDLTIWDRFEPKVFKQLVEGLKLEIPETKKTQENKED